MGKKDIDKAIRDYLSGKPSPEGEALFNQWYASFDDQQDALRDLDDQQKEQLGKEIFRRVKAQKTESKGKSGKIAAMPWYRVAAVFIGILILGSAYLAYQNLSDDTIRYATEFGEIKTVHLPDGSEVVLNANSNLQYSADFQTDSDRQVWLEGEAYFLVTHTEDDQRFVVHTTDLSVEVLGTEFNVSRRREDTRVVLASGKVKLAIPNQLDTTSVLMQPGELVYYSPGDKKLTHQIVNTELHTAWKKQKFMLNNTSLDEIALFLEDYYGFEVTLSDELKGLRLSATAEFTTKDEKVILEAISEIYNIRVQRDGNRLTLTKE